MLVVNCKRKSLEKLNPVTLYNLQQQQPLSQAKKNFTETEHNDDAGADPP
jgi:hypothetical protein